MHKVCGVVCAVLILLGSAAQAATRPRGVGCSLTSRLNSAGQSGPQLIWPSGVAIIDNSFQAEGMMMVREFGVAPRCFFTNDFGAPNAFASPQVVHPMGPDGTVLIGLDLIRTEMEEHNGEAYSLAAIMAHEFGHILQYKNRFQGPTPLRELHADYLAGWYLGRKSNFVYMKVEDAFRGFFNRGDYHFNDPDHHGTPAQRMAAIQAGCIAGGRGSHLGQAYQDALKIATMLLQNRAHGPDASGPGAMEAGEEEVAESPKPPALQSAASCTEMVSIVEEARSDVGRFCQAVGDKGRYSGPVVSLSGMVGVIDANEVECKSDHAWVKMVFPDLSLDAGQKFLGTCTEGTLSSGSPEAPTVQVFRDNKKWVFELTFHKDTGRTFVDGRWLTGPLEAYLWFGKPAEEE